MKEWKTEDTHSYSFFANIEDKKGAIVGHSILLPNKTMRLLVNIILSNSELGLSKYGTYVLNEDKTISKRTIYIPNETFKHNKKFIQNEMTLKGRPVIYAVEKNEKIYALEGSHRISFANDIGYIPKIVIIDLDDVVCYDHSQNIFCLEKNLTEVYENCIAIKKKASDAIYPASEKLKLKCEVIYYDDIK